MPPFGRTHAHTPEQHTHDHRVCVDDASIASSRPSSPSSSSSLSSSPQQQQQQPTAEPACGSGSGSGRVVPRSVGSTAGGKSEAEMQLDGARDADPRYGDVPGTGLGRDSDMPVAVGLTVDAEAAACAVSDTGSVGASSVPVTDAAHVRPSLKMTAQEFSEAKGIILDLLGWGVPSEYLMGCGVAREALYYAFTELNLRLPKDFDTAGIVAYEPPARGK